MKTEQSFRSTSREFLWDHHFQFVHMSCTGFLNNYYHDVLSCTGSVNYDIQTPATSNKVISLLKLKQIGEVQIGH